MPIHNRLDFLFRIESGEDRCENCSFSISQCNNCRNRKMRIKYRNKLLSDPEVIELYELTLNGKKRCSKCKIEKLLDLNFRIYKDKYRSNCKVCESEYRQQYEHKNSKTINAQRRKRRADPIRGIIFTQRDRQRILFQQTGFTKSKAQTSLIREWLGCSVDYCKSYLEALFLEGMNWSNRGIGKDKWQIDHIIPVSKTEIDITGNIIDNEWNRKIWHYSNLQPLWHIENAEKSNKYIPCEIFYL